MCPPRRRARSLRRATHHQLLCDAQVVEHSSLLEQTVQAEQQKKKSEDGNGAGKRSGRGRGRSDGVRRGALSGEASVSPAVNAGEDTGGSSKGRQGAGGGRRGGRGGRGGRRGRGGGGGAGGPSGDHDRPAPHTTSFEQLFV